MRVFVTGGARAIGRGVVRELISRGAQITALSASPQDDQVLLDLGAAPCPGAVEAPPLDVLARCEAVIHAEAEARPWAPADLYWRTNVEATRALLAAARAAGVGRFVLISDTGAVFGGRPLRDIDEQAPLALNARHPLARSRAHAERAVIGADGPALDALCVRAALVWGARDIAFFEALQAQAAAGRLVWAGDGRAAVSTTHVDNLAHGAALALERGEGGQTYAVTDGAPTSAHSFLGDILAAQGLAAEGVKAPAWLVRPGALAAESLWRAAALAGTPPLLRVIADAMAVEQTASDAKARALLGYRPLLSRQEGLPQLYGAL